MILRDGVHAAGRMLTRGLLHPRMRDRPPMSWTYLRLYLLGKRFTERRELATLRSLITPGMVIADIGANVGFYALEMAASVGRSGRVLAFEPDPFNFGLLRARASRAPLANVDVYQVALGDAPRRGGAILQRVQSRRQPDRPLARREARRGVLGPDADARRSVERRVRPARSGEDRRDENRRPGRRGARPSRRGAHARARASLDLARASRPIICGAPGSSPERFLADLAALDMELFEVTETADLRPLADFGAHTCRIGSGYGDVVVIARDLARRRAAAAHGLS